MSKRQRLWLCLPPWAACTLDQLLTLWGQPTHYWDVSYDYALEASPPFNWLLRQHPLAFEAGIAAWVLLFTAVMRKNMPGSVTTLVAPSRPTAMP